MNLCGRIWISIKINGLVANGLVHEDLNLYHVFNYLPLHLKETNHAMTTFESITLTSSNQHHIFTPYTPPTPITTVSLRCVLPGSVPQSIYFQWHNGTSVHQASSQPSPTKQTFGWERCASGHAQLWPGLILIVRFFRLNSLISKGITNNQKPKSF